MTSLRDKIFGFDPYAHFDPNWAEPDLQGWGHEHGIFEASITKVKPKLIVEVGTWKGASAIRMGQLCAKAGLSTEIVCVDTWLGSPSTLMHNGSESQTDRFAALRLVNGFPMLYYTFMRNVVEAGLQGVITPLPQTSEHAAKILRFHKARPDIIYLDAAMEKEPVFRDLMFYWPLLAKGGHLIGDDYKSTTVRAGVEKFSAKMGLSPEVKGGKYRFVKA